MQTGQPSTTALRAAAQRAAHQIFDGGRIFGDPFARPILGPQADELIDAVAQDRPMRVWFAARSRLAEDYLHAAAGRGVGQIVILGAGLDTFALRNPYPADQLCVFEVDHPVTQQWKLARLHEAGLRVNGRVINVAVDFEHDGLADQLARAGFRSDLPAFFHWLGVTMYLERGSVRDILRFAATTRRPEIVFDYTEPLKNYATESQEYIKKIEARVARMDERWITFFDPSDIAGELQALGFDARRDWDLDDIRSHYLGASAPASRAGAGPHFLYARKS